MIRRRDTPEIRDKIGRNFNTWLSLGADRGKIYGLFRRRYGRELLRCCGIEERI